MNFPYLARQCDDGAENKVEFGLPHMLTMMDDDDADDDDDDYDEPVREER